MKSDAQPMAIMRWAMRTSRQRYQRRWDDGIAPDNPGGHVRGENWEMGSCSMNRKNSGLSPVVCDVRECDVMSWIGVRIKAMRWQAKGLAVFFLLLMAMNVCQYLSVANIELIEPSSLKRSEGKLFFEQRGKYQVVGLKQASGEAAYFSCAWPLNRRGACLRSDLEKQYSGNDAVVLWTDAYRQRFPDAKGMVELTVDGKVVERNSYAWRAQIVESRKTDNLRDRLGMSLFLLGLVVTIFLVEGFRNDNKHGNSDGN